MLLEYFTEGSTVTQTEAMMYVLGIGACNLLQVTIGPQFVVRAINCAHRWKAGVVGLLYKKVGHMHNYIHMMPKVSVILQHLTSLMSHTYISPMTKI